ncbi:hypothetical protein L1887_53032 [Cichorium endivia]|nr:hypothetical protein L1887_53032 [Cichorium endivia]
MSLDRCGRGQRRRWGRIAGGALGPWRVPDHPCLGEAAFGQPTGGRNPPQGAKGACAAQYAATRAACKLTSLAGLLLRLGAVMRRGNARKISSQRRSPRLRGSTARVASTPPHVLDLEESRSASFHLNPLDLTDRPTASPCPERALLSRLGSGLAEERLHRRAALLSKLPFSSALPGRGVAARKGQHHYLSPLASRPSAAVRKRPTLSSAVHAAGRPLPR